MGMFDNLKQPKNLTAYNLMKGVTDFSRVGQFNVHEKGYYFLRVATVPKFIEMLAAENSTYQVILDNYVHILENEFRGIDGLEDMTSENFEITDGIRTLSMISKVILPSNGTITMRFTEKSGAPLTKFHELFLTSLKDPGSQVKTYKGLIKSGKLEDDWENEVFTFVYGATDNTFTKLEKAYIFAAAQPTKAELSIFQGERGTVETSELGCEYSVFSIPGELANAKAKAILDWMNNDENPNKIINEYDKVNYAVLDKITTK